MKTTKLFKKNIRDLGIEKFAVELEKEWNTEPADKVKWSFPIVEENTKTTFEMFDDLCKAMKEMKPIPKICIRLSSLIPKGTVLTQDNKELINQYAIMFESDIYESDIFRKDILEYDFTYNVNKEEFLEAMDKMEKPEAGLGSVSGRVIPDYKGIPVIE